MTIRISRRRFLSTTAAAGARRHRDALSLPRRRPAADHPWRAVRRRRRSTAAWCGRAPTGRRRCWSRSRPPSPSAMHARCRRSRRCRRATSPRRCCWKTCPSGQDIFYRVRFRDLAAYRHRRRAGGRPLPHRARRPARRQLRLGRRRRRPGLGHQSRRWRHVHLRHHAQAHARTSSCIPATRSMPTARSRPK